MDRDNKQMKKRKYIRTWCLSAVVIVIVMIVFGTAYLKKNKDDQGKEQNGSTVETQNENQFEEVEAFEIETPYCSLRYPEKWKEQIKIEYNEEDAYKVEFYGLVENKEPQHLFDICFNSDDGDLLGYFDNNGEITNVSVDIKEIEFDDEWTQEQIDLIYAMQEEMNYVVSMLNKEANYVNP